MDGKADLKTEKLVADAFECAEGVSCKKNIEDIRVASILHHNREVKAAMAKQLSDMGISHQGIERVLNLRASDRESLKLRGVDAAPNEGAGPLWGHKDKV